MYCRPLAASKPSLSTLRSRSRPQMPPLLLTLSTTAFMATGESSRRDLADPSSTAVVARRILVALTPVSVAPPFFPLAHSRPPAAVAPATVVAVVLPAVRAPAVPPPPPAAASPVRSVAPSVPATSVVVVSPPPPPASVAATVWGPEPGSTCSHDRTRTAATPRAKVRRPLVLLMVSLLAVSLAGCVGGPFRWVKPVPVDGVSPTGTRCPPVSGRVRRRPVLACAAWGGSLPVEASGLCRGWSVAQRR